MTDIPSDGAEPRTYAGEIKWFSYPKGYGFVNSPAFEGDILLHGKVLGRFEGSELPSGTKVMFTCDISDHGPRVTELVSIEFQPSSQQPALPADVEALPQVPARIKWFDVEKGFGFANAFGSTDDIFLHASVLGHASQWDLSEGQAVSLRFKSTDRGLIAVDIRPWKDGA